MAAHNSKTQRLRSIPNPKYFNIAAFYCVIHYLGLITLLTTLAIVLVNPTETGLIIVLASLGFSILSWLFAYSRRKNTFCPLCKGTPLINSGATPHSSARRIFPFNNGVSAVISIIATQKFCCMDCGAKFDLLKISKHQLRNDPQAANTQNPISKP